MALSLNDFDRDEFLSIQKNLILFINKKFKIYEGFETIDDVNVVNLTEEKINKGIFPIREKMYHADHIKEFCNKNEFLGERQKAIVESWGSAYEDNFYIIKHLKGNTILLTMNEEKLYGVVGISGGLDEFFQEEMLPIIIKTILLPFNNKIVYDGFFSYQNILFGGNTTRRLKQVYTKLKGEEGIITEPKGNVFLGDLKANKPDEEAIKFLVKEGLKENRFPGKAWALAKKNKDNRLSFEHEYARIFSKHQIDALQNHDEIKSMYYAGYRSCIIGVSDNKKSLIEFCKQHFPEIAEYVYIFKA